MRLVLLGAPGSGKGTQAGFILERLGMAHVASGDLFRQAAARDDELGRQAQSYMQKGLLVPDEITIKMILERIAETDCAKGFLLDGFPRNLEQAKALDEALGDGVDGVIYIKVATEELVRRLSGRLICRDCQTPYHQVSSPPKVEGKCDQCDGELYQRPDDTADTVRKRLEVYFQQTAPLIEHYKEARKLIEIKGEGDIEDIGQRIVAALPKG